MTKFFAVIFAVGLSMAAVSAAEAAGGCGIGWHRGPHGGCLRNYAHPAMHACPRGYHLGPYGHCRANR
ncbi:MAG TPA: hypothetical protein VLT91_00930 [Rhizomicrobium sp.]|nr:hypothetical protein [Rhizomicrobium sp.]